MSARHQVRCPYFVYLIQFKPPSVFLSPDMTIKTNHRHVDMQGMVFLPYLHEWKSDSNLEGLVEITSNVFSIEPPLFAKPTNTGASAIPKPQMQSYTTLSATGEFCVLFFMVNT